MNWETARKSQCLKWAAERGLEVCAYSTWGGRFWKARVYTHERRQCLVEQEHLSREISAIRRVCELADELLKGAPNE